MNTTTQAPATTIDVPVVSDDEGTRREILLRAAEVIETHGWTHGSDGIIPGGPYCVMGAVAHAAGSDTWTDVTGELTYQWEDAERVLGVSYQDGYSWNDPLQFVKFPRLPGGTLKKGRRMTAEEVVSRTFRRMANGMSFEDATADTRYRRHA